MFTMMQSSVSIDYVPVVSAHKHLKFGWEMKEMGTTLWERWFGDEGQRDVGRDVGIMFWAHSRARKRVRFFFMQSH